jgi:hypothetical protein
MTLLSLMPPPLAEPTPTSDQPALLTIANDTEAGCPAFTCTSGTVARRETVITRPKTLAYFIFPNPLDLRCCRLAVAVPVAQSLQPAYCRCNPGSMHEGHHIWPIPEEIQARRQHWGDSAPNSDRRLCQSRACPSSSHHTLVPGCGGQGSALSGRRYEWRRRLLPMPHAGDIVLHLAHVYRLLGHTCTNNECRVAATVLQSGKCSIRPNCEGVKRTTADRRRWLRRFPR